MNKNIDISALFSHDNIKIIATKNIHNNIITIHEELIGHNTFDIKDSIKKAINLIENKISKKINSINVVFDDFMKNSESLEITEKILEKRINNISNNFLDKKDYEDIIKNIIFESDKSEKDKKLISIIPFKFIYIENNEDFEKESAFFPFDKKITKLKAFFSIKYMSKSKFKKSTDYFESLGINVENTMLESQLIAYEKVDNLKDNDVVTSFSLVIENNKTMLISNVNNVAIKTDVLKFSFSNLIKKIANEFGISTYEAKKIVDIYGTLDQENLKNENEIVFFAHSSNGEIVKPIRKIDILETLKSFLKSICTEANALIANRISSKFDLKLSGQLSGIEGVENYCLKYFNQANIIVNNKNTMKYGWNKSFTTIKNYWKYQMISNNFESNNFNYNNGKKVFQNYEKRHFFTDNVKGSLEIVSI